MFKIFRNRGRRAKIRIAVVGNLTDPNKELIAMNWIRWFEIGKALARRGYTVDLLTDEPGFRNSERKQKLGRRFSKRSTYQINWREYDVIKVLFHSGFKSFKERGGVPHPFIITKLGSAVASEDREGIAFYGDVRKKLFEIQNDVMRESKYVVTLTEKNEECLRNEYPMFKNYLRVPTGVNKEIPKPGKDPYKKDNFKVCLYAGHLYDLSHQPEVNRMWQSKLNDLGKRLRRENVRLCFVGTGNTDLLNPDYVINFGFVSNQRIWDYQYYADVGVVLSAGPVSDNESSKIYYYLRGGLPVVAEAPPPNSKLVHETGYGSVILYDDIENMTSSIVEWAFKEKPQREKVMQWMAENHSWDKRVEVYSELIDREIMDKNVTDD